MTQKKKMTWAEWERAEKQDTPTLWRDMTDAEKGALLLAHHQGKVIEWNGVSEKKGEWIGWDECDEDCLWDGGFDGHGFAYRIKPEPKKPREFWIDPARGQVVALERVDFIHVREVMGDEE